MVDYVRGWFDVLTSDQTKAKYGDLFCVNKAKDSAFLGLSLWSFSYQMTYPPMKWFDNEFLPGTPPDNVFDYLKANLHRLRTDSCTQAQLNGDFTVKDEWIKP